MVTQRFPLITNTCNEFMGLVLNYEYYVPVNYCQIQSYTRLEQVLCKNVDYLTNPLK
jgi:hypothetical protein